MAFAGAGLTKESYLVFAVAAAAWLALAAAGPRRARLAEAATVVVPGVVLLGLWWAYVAWRAPASAADAEAAGAVPPFAGWAHALGLVAELQRRLEGAAQNRYRGYAPLVQQPCRLVHDRGPEVAAGDCTGVADPAVGSPHDPLGQQSTASDRVVPAFRGDADAPACCGGPPVGPPAPPGGSLGIGDCRLMVPPSRQGGQGGQGGQDGQDEGRQRPDRRADTGSTWRWRRCCTSAPG